MKSESKSLADRVLEARDRLLVARKAKRQARLQWSEACFRASIFDDHGNVWPKFIRLPDGDFEDYVFSKSFEVVAPEFISGDDASDHPDFVFWREASKNKHEANKAHGIALRTLLSIGRK